MRPIDAAIALRFEALRLARLAVRQELRSQGVKLSYIEASEITRHAKVWFDQNRAELIDVGLRNVLAEASCKGFLCSNLRCKMIIGYARVSTDGQELDAQLSALRSAGAEKVFAEKESGAKTDRRQLARAIDALGAGDVLLVTRLDRLARSTRDLLNVLATVSERKAGFRSLADPMIDTTSPHGKLILAVLAALAEFERSMILARTSEGRKRAQAWGVRFGRKPKLTKHQITEALRRRAEGEALTEIGRSYNVSHSTISRLG
jgi:DNA invertase Pin-like site-specific DNA recombinase